MSGGGAEAGRGADILLRCDGSQVLGLGHVKRCLALADALSQDHGLTCRFAGRFEGAAARLVEQRGYPISPWREAVAETTWLDDVIARTAPRALLCDIRTDLTQAALARWRADGLFVVTLDDGSPRRLAADLAVLPPTAEVLELDWPGFGGEALIGWAWTVLSDRPMPRLAGSGEGPARLLLAMGGSDPAGLTQRCARLLRPLASRIAPVFVIGPTVDARDAVKAALADLWPQGEIADRPETLAPLMATADLALVAYGVTAQELAAAGVPALYLALSEDHRRSAEALAATGAGRTLGRHDRLSEADIRAAVAALAADPAARREMAVAGPRTLDGRGAERLAARIAENIRIQIN